VHEVSLEALDAGGVVQEEEVPSRRRSSCSPTFLEALQPSDRLEPDANVQLVREERADTTGTVARRTASESAPLKQDRPSAASSAR
jgi:hypothetical protein